MASSGKKVVPLFLAVLIAVGAALYMGMLSYRPEVIDEPPLNTDAPSTATGTARSNDQAALPPNGSGAATDPPASPANEAPGTASTDAADRAPPPASAPAGASDEPEPNDDDDEAPAPPAPAPSKTDGPVGSLDKQTIMDGIAAIKPTIKACFEEGLKHDPSLAGRVVINFEIEAEDGEGRITRGEVKEAETQSLFFEACVLQQVSKATVDAPRGGGKVVVNYPFNFDPGGGWGGEAPEGDDDGAGDEADGE